MKKKILFLLPSLVGGGAERTVVNIINHMDKNKFDITLVLIASYKNNENQHDYIDFVNSEINIKFLNTNLSKFSIFKIIFKLNKVIKLENPDLLFSTTLNANIILLITTMLNKNKRPTIVRETTNRTSLKTNIIWKIITKYLYNKANSIIALSIGVKNDLIENFKVNKKNINVIYNPIDIDYINKVKNQDIQHLDFRDTHKNIIAVGRLIKAKDFPTLLKAFKEIDNQINSRLLILGKGPEENELKLITEKLNIKNKVLFMGFQNNPYKYINASDLFILSSTREGFAHVIVEAMSLGVPVISTNCPSGPKEIILNNKYGRLVEVGNYKKIADETIRLFESPDEYSKLSSLGQIRAYDFEAEKIVNEYQELFLQIINEFNTKS